MTPPLPPTEFRGAFRVDDEARAVYSESAGIGRALPRAIAVPTDVDDLITLVGWASREAVPLIPRGSGSSMPNGAIGDGVIVDLSRWRAVDDVDVDRKTIRVGPGVLRGEVDKIARSRGLRFPVDPSSGAFCTVGGMASTNAAGAHSMHFGPMRPWVRALDCVFPDGTRAEIRRGAHVPHGIPALDRFLAIAPKMVAEEKAKPSAHPGVIKDSSGYGVASYAQTGELIDLLVGAEGTLMFIAAIELDLIPIAPFTSSVLGGFPTLEQAVDAATRARSAGAVACELLDKSFLDVAASGGAPRQVPEASESALLAEVEGTTAEETAERARGVERIFRDAGASTVKIALDKPTETELWELRHAASPILAKLDPSLRSMQFVEDCAVPPEHLPTFVRGVRDILAKHETRGVIFGHAGDSHIHVNPLVDVARDGWRDRIRHILDAVTTLTASLGGTLTGEHGDGRLRTPLMSRVWSPQAISHFVAIKGAFDPEGILNPGVKVPVAGEEPIAEVKYDPSLAPHPAKARAALAKVEAERAYATFRLDLLQAHD